MASRSGMIRVEGGPKFAGVYYRVDKRGVKTFYINYRKADGKVTNEPVGKESHGFTKSSALELRIERVRAVKYGMALPDKKAKSKVMTFDAAFDRWEKWAIGNKLKDIRGPRSKYNAHLKDTIGSLPMDQITVDKLEEIKATLNKDRAVATTRGVLHIVHRVYAKMADLEKYTGPNPMDKVTKVTGNVHRDRYLTIDQTTALLKHLKGVNHNMYQQAALSAYNGLRRDEIMRLTPLDIDLKNDTITVSAKSPTDRVHVRTMDIFPQTREVIDGLLAEKDWAPGERFFTKPHRHDFEVAVEALGFNNGVDKRDTRKRIVFHSLRHTFASQLLDATGNLKLVQQEMGHKTIKTTERYTHTNEDIKMMAKERMRQAYAGQEKLEGMEVRLSGN